MRQLDVNETRLVAVFPWGTSVHPKKFGRSLNTAACVRAVHSNFVLESPLETTVQQIMQEPC